MKKIIARNIAFITAIFMITLAIMLITNYFQAKDVSPLQTQVIETLKQLNDQNSGNPELQEQIRQLDLMARKAYFVNMDHLMRGVYLLLGMLAVFLISLRVYFSEYKDIPDKDIDPIDEWVMKTQARKYVGILATGMAAIALLFVVFSMPFMQANESSKESEPEAEAIIAQNTITDQSNDNKEPVVITNNNITEEETISSNTETVEEITDSEDKNADENESNNEQKEASINQEAVVKETPVEDVKPEKDVITTEVKEESTAKVSVPKITSNAFRGNEANGHSKATNIPVKWDIKAGTNIAWKTEISLSGQSSPVINGNRIFITGANAESRQLLCYDLNSGKQLWNVAASNIPGSPNEVPETTPDTGLASPTAATNGKQVCAIFATGDVICADMEGKLLWAKNIGVPENHYGYASSLFILNDQLFIQYDNSNANQIISLNTNTGEEIWRKERDDKISWSSPSLAYVNNTPQLILMSDPSITAYNPVNGDLLWRVECMMGEVGASTCSYNGIIYGASEYAKLVAINGADGSVLWESMDYLPEASSPVATENNLYLATSYGVVASFDTKTGALKKEHETNAEFYSSPMLVEGKIYLFSNSGKMHIFSADDEFNLLDSFETGEKTFATPAFTEGRMIVRTNQSIYCVKGN
ncbi:PQQ-binding-like beta-propeller repeat protein [Plebeiibacterium sediminum]|uniref:PQQ-like beta-propeller repeat protein n=1 Tax=Plebeiibacterium sediminum TaxID=2992112 RepID=A0AAE3M1M4_9BACT|nr:PQQ-binding-like beta-propeller repeat protein [Plebeiobacterium sediminum]MCW3785271.1 PQQ-like beta-propeller repeat protein [Plebeiobacterium sediminum]